MIRYFSFMAIRDRLLRRQALKLGKELAVQEFARERYPLLARNFPLWAGGKPRDHVPFALPIRIRQYKGRFTAARDERRSN